MKRFFLWLRKTRRDPRTVLKNAGLHTPRRRVRYPNTMPASYGKRSADEVYEYLASKL